MIRTKERAAHLLEAIEAANAPPFANREIYVIDGTPGFWRRAATVKIKDGDKEKRIDDPNATLAFFGGKMIPLLLDETIGKELAEAKTVQFTGEICLDVRAALAGPIEEFRKKHGMPTGEELAQAELLEKGKMSAEDFRKESLTREDANGIRGYPRNSNPRVTCWKEAEPDDGPRVTGTGAIPPVGVHVVGGFIEDIQKTETIPPLPFEPSEEPSVDGV